MAQECIALYWHLIDMIWVVLFALLYLPGRSHG
jgi:cytochrome c oxidase subunit 3